MHRLIGCDKMSRIWVFMAILAFVGSATAVVMPCISVSKGRAHIVASALPGDPVVTGTLFQGVVNCVSIYSNLIFLRVGLSFFPQIRKRAPFLKPVYTVTSPYLKIFRKNIPPIGGFDVSAIPAIFILDIFSQATVALGAEPPFDKLQRGKGHALQDRRGAKATTRRRSPLLLK